MAIGQMGIARYETFGAEHPCFRWIAFQQDVEEREFLDF